MDLVQETPSASPPWASAMVAGLRRYFETGRTLSLEWRLRQLKALRRLLHEHAAELRQAMYADLGKPEVEAQLEIGFTVYDLNHAIDNLARWMKPQRVRTSLVAQPGRSWVRREPLGVVLIIAPWNYPLHLAVTPLVGAVAAGNCAIVKPSELAGHTSAVLARRLPEYLDPEAFRAVEGGVPETTELLRERFDHILYTGNGRVAHVILEAAARHLTPVTLELGGKCPCLVDRDANLEIAARRILWAKFLNAGQTCVAPDYVLVHQDVEEALLERFQATLREFFGSDPQKSPDYGRIINVRHYHRLMDLMRSGEVVAGGVGEEADRYIAPTVLRNVPGDAPIMNEEIFGPLLPVLRVAGMDEAIAQVNQRPKPLALYLFSRDEAVQRRVTERTSSGGCTINHVGFHMANLAFPFGGVGPSGMGSYHGRASFETFSHLKPVLRKPARFDLPLLYPPHGDRMRRWLLRMF